LRTKGFPAEQGFFSFWKTVFLANSVCDHGSACGPVWDSFWRQVCRLQLRRSFRPMGSDFGFSRPSLSLNPIPRCQVTRSWVLSKLAGDVSISKMRNPMIFLQARH
jgi:hypothetical protein